MEIEGKEWVRLKDGRIRQFKQYVNKEDIELTRPYNTAKIKDIVNHSKNIIDLIEVGDHVNGYYVRKIANYNNELCVFDLNVMQWIPITEIDVFYSIVTHEQFSSIEYKVEEDK